MRNVLVLVSMVLLLIACDDKASSSQGSFQPPRDMGPGSDAGTPNVVGYPYKLVIDGPNEISMYYNQETELRVRYLDDGDQDGTAGDVPIFDGTVELRFEPLDQNFAALRSRARRTDSNGLAIFNLASNAFTGRFRVIAEAPNARPVAWTVRIGKDPLGDVNVTVTYDSTTGRYTPEEFSRISVKLVEGDCTSALTANNRRYSFTGPDINPFDGEDVTAFTAVPGGIDFAALAYGKNSDGRNVARGCTENIVSSGGQATEATVVLTDEPLEFKGVFNVDHEFDITEMLRGTDDSGLANFVDVMEILGAIGGGYGEGENPRGDGIIRLLCERAQIDAAICTAIQFFGAAALEQQIESSVDPNTLQALDILGDLYQNLSVFNVYGEIEFYANYPNAEGYLRNNDSRWQGIRFVWRNDCPLNSADCIREFPLVEDDQGRESPIIASFDALYEGPTDTLFVSRHEMSLSYGRLVVVALERWILPAVIPEANQPDANGMTDDVVTLAEFLAQLVDCAAIVNGDATLEALCAGGLTIGATFLRDALFDIDDSTDLITLEGSVKVADDIVDLRADRLYDGVWNGTFGANGDLTSDIGTFSGCRDEDCEAIEALMTMPSMP